MRDAIKLVIEVSKTIGTVQMKAKEIEPMLSRMKSNSYYNGMLVGVLAIETIVVMIVVLIVFGS